MPALKKGVAFHPLNQKNYQSLLTALIIVLSPHFFYLPIIVSLLVGFVLLLWQVLVYREGHFHAAQHKALQYGVVLLGLLLIYLEYKTFFGVEAGCAALVMVLLGKAFEVKNYRDAIIQLNFALFVVASLFLYGQEPYLAIAAVIGVISCFYGMYQLQNYHNAYEEVVTDEVSSKELSVHAIKTVLRIIAFATPLMVILFLFFPRLPPLWSIPEQQHQAKTGVTDELSFGDIAELSQSTELAFRVIFDDFTQMPNKSNLYWRATVLENFDGYKWTQNFYTKFAPPLVISKKSEQSIPEWYIPRVEPQLAHYQLIMEPNFQSWTYALEHSAGYEPLLMRRDLTVHSPFEVIQRRVFDFQYIQPKPLAQPKTIEPRILEINTGLGEDTHQNPKTRQMAEKLFVENEQSAERYAQAILRWIRIDGFSYTLSPPTLSGNRVDDFLFRTKAGFCEHYASAFVTMMRMVGIPARIVVGYQGGQWAPDGKSWEVRQLDAHAWTEIWIKDKGWIRIDPTSAIAPERIEQGMQDFSQRNDQLFGDTTNALWQAQKYQWMTKARIWIDYANYQWQNKVVGFDQDKQRSWLKKWSIDQLSEQLLYMMVGLFAVIGLTLWWLSQQQSIKRTELDQALDRLSRKLSKTGLQHQEGEPVLTWLNRIRTKQPDEKNAEIIRLYTQHVYISPLTPQELKRLMRLLKKYSIRKED